MSRPSWCVVVATIATLATTAHAQDLSPEESRAEAQARNQAGAALVAKQDWAGALADFQAAYGFFPSPKVLLNIAAMLEQLGESVEAANVYQRYLDDPGSDSTRRAEALAKLTRLDADLAVLSIKVTPLDAELQLVGWTPGWVVPSTEPTWLPATELARVRVAAGGFVVKARKPGWKPSDVNGTAAAGANRSVELVLSELHDEVVAAPIEPAQPAPADDDPATAIAAGVPPVQLGAVVDVAVDASKLEGAAVSPGLSVRLIGRLELVARAQLGGVGGLYLGAAYYLRRGRLRPQLSLGVPLFFSEGARVGVRGAAGVCYDLGPHLSVVGELGGEYFFNPEMDRLRLALVPILGVHARL